MLVITYTYEHIYRANNQKFLLTRQTNTLQIHIMKSSILCTIYSVYYDKHYTSLLFIIAINYIFYIKLYIIYFFISYNFYILQYTYLSGFKSFNTLHL